MSSAEIRLARAVVAAPTWEAARQAAHDALARKRAQIKRGEEKKKAIPVVVKVRALTPKHEAQIATAMVRAAVWTRAGGRCEVCGAPATEMHHLLSGPDRKTKESAETCVALCWPCHKNAHKGWVFTLEALRAFCESRGMNVARMALNHRIAKVLEAQKFAETTR